MEKFGSSLTTDYKSILVERLMDDASYVVRKFSDSATNRDKETFFEDVGYIYNVMARYVNVFGGSFSDEFKSKIAKTVISDACYVMSSVHKYEGLDYMLRSLNYLLNSLGTVSVSLTQKNNFEEMLIDVSLRAVARSDSDGISLVTMIECLDLLEVMPIDPVPVLSVNATMDEVSAELECMADSALCEIIESPAEYAEFRSWAKSVRGDASSVKSSQHAAISYMLGANVLFDSEPTIELSDVEVDDGSGHESDKGVIILSVTVTDGGNPVAVASEKVASMFEATSSLGDWDGEAKLIPTVEVLDGDGATMRFKVKPGDGKSTSAFLRIRK